MAVPVKLPEKVVAVKILVDGLYVSSASEERATPEPVEVREKARK